MRSISLYFFFIVLSLLERGMVSQYFCHFKSILCLIDVLTSLVGKTDIVGWMIILVARSAALSAISLPYKLLFYIHIYIMMLWWFSVFGSSVVSKFKLVFVFFYIFIILRWSVRHIPKCLTIRN